LARALLHFEREASPRQHTDVNDDDGGGDDDDDDDDADE
jgi:hypothetical protein